MKTLFAAAAAVALLAAAEPVSAQMYQQPMPPAPSFQTSPAPVYQGPVTPAPTYQMSQPVQPMPQPSYISGTPSWMQDDGSSSDHPIHNPGDRSGDALNSQYQGGIPTAPGTGFPAYPGQR
jgi:hypothetical protein